MLHDPKNCPLGLLCRMGECVDYWAANGGRELRRPCAVALCQENACLPGVASSTRDVGAGVRYVSTNFCERHRHEWVTLEEDRRRELSAARATMRDRFAAHVMPKIAWAWRFRPDATTTDRYASWDEVAIESYAAADAMLRARESTVEG